MAEGNGDYIARFERIEQILERMAEVQQVQARNLASLVEVQQIQAFRSRSDVRTHRNGAG